MRRVRSNSLMVTLLEIIGCKDRACFFAVYRAFYLYQSWADRFYAGVLYLPQNSAVAGMPEFVVLIRSFFQEFLRCAVENEVICKFTHNDMRRCRRTARSRHLCTSEQL